MPRKPRIPGYRRHSSGQARVTLNGEDHLLGPFGSAESKEAYRQFIAEWLERGRTSGKIEKEPLSVNEVILVYWKWAIGYYGFDDTDRGDAYCLRDALVVLRKLYGRSKAVEFGPLALKACRRQMIDQGWSRSYTNAQVDRIRRMFRWAAEEEMLPGSIHQNLRAVASLRRGKTTARETEKVKPVPSERIDQTLPHAPPMIQAMVRLQLLIGCRPAEVCLLRPMDLDRSNPACWLYRPGSDQGPLGEHKTAHHGHERMIFIGPRAQEILLPYLGAKPDAYCFCPAAGEVRRNAARREARKTPLSPSYEGRPQKKRPRRQRAPGDRYDTHSYRRAIARACTAAHCQTCAHCRRQEGEKSAARRARLRSCKELKAAIFSPNQLRHNRATELRPYGLDVTKTILGHAKVETTQIYAEKDVQAAMELVARIG